METTSNTAPSGAPQRTSEPRAQTLRGQRAVNRLMRGLLRTPLLCRAVGRRLVTIYVIGRVSRRRYVIPVAYTRHGDELLIGTPFGWGRNLRSGEPVDIRYKGRVCSADVEVLTAEAEVVEAYAIMSRDNHNFAKFNRIALDPAGNPDPLDLRLAWEAGARAVRLRLPA